MDRRGFLTKGITSYLFDFVKAMNLSDVSKEMDKASEKRDYFESFFSSYPLLSEAPYEFLVEAGEKLGIDTNNKTKIELAREIFAESRVKNAAD